MAVRGGHRVRGGRDYRPPRPLAHRLGHTWLATAVIVFSAALTGTVVVVAADASAQPSADWSVLSQLPSSFSSAEALACTTPSDCALFGNGPDSAPVALYTADGGDMWSSVTLPADFASTTDAAVDQVSCVPGGTVCVAVSNGVGPGSGTGRAGTMAGFFFLYSSDGGQTWSDTTVSSPVELGAGITTGTVSCPTSTFCTAELGEDGSMFTSTDGGQSWAPTTTQPPLIAQTVSCWANDQCMVVSDQQTFSVTTDGGATWTAAATLTSQSFGVTGLDCPNASDCVAMGNITLADEAGLEQVFASTSNGGATWSVSPSDSGDGPATVLSGLTALSCSTATECMAVGDSNRSGLGPVVAQLTGDGGTSWEDASAPSALEAGNTGGAAVVSCPATGTCIVVNDGGGLASPDALSYSTAAQTPTEAPSNLSASLDLSDSEIRATWSVVSDPTVTGYVLGAVDTTTGLPVGSVTVAATVSETKIPLSVAIADAFSVTVSAANDAGTGPIGSFALGTSANVAEMTGTVTDTSGNPVAGAMLDICPTTGGGGCTTPSTAASGTWTSAPLPDGTYDIDVSPPAPLKLSLLPTSVTATLTGTATLTVPTIELSPASAIEATLTGAVTLSGSPLANAPVAVCNGSSACVQFPSSATGTWTSAPLPDGTYTVTAYAGSGYADELSSFPGTSVTITGTATVTVPTINLVPAVNLASIGASMTLADGSSAASLGFVPHEDLPADMTLPDTSCPVTLCTLSSLTVQGYTGDGQPTTLDLPTQGATDTDTFSLTSSSSGPVVTSVHDLSFPIGSAIEDLDSGSSFNLAATVSPEVSIDQESLNFGDVAPGTVASQEVTITNLGDDAVPLAISIFGADDGFEPLGAPPPPDLAPDESYTEDVGFEPSPGDEGNEEVGDIDVQAGGDEEQEELSGYVETPEFTISPPKYDFGAVPVGGQASQTFTITNTETVAGSADIVLDDPDLAFTLNPGDCVTAFGPVVLAPQGSCQVTVTFVPPNTDPAGSCQQTTLAYGGAVHAVVPNDEIFETYSLLSGVGVYPPGQNCSPPAPIGVGPGYIDPGGSVTYTAPGVTGARPYPGATVALSQAASAAGPFNEVPSGSDVMVPSTNPLTSGALGGFSWLTLPGEYEVSASAPNCSAATTPPFAVPPPQDDLSLQMSCSSAPPVTSTMTTLSSDQSGAYAGAAVTFRADVSSGVGTVDFTDGTTDLGTNVVESGVATLVTTALPLGPNTITATYSGDGNDAPSTSGPVSVDVTALPAETAPVFSLGSPPTTATAGQAYSYTFGASDVQSYSLDADAPSWLEIDPLAGTVTGTPPSGTTSFSYSVTGTGSVGPTTVGPFTVTVTSPTITTLLSSLDPSTYGQSVTFTASVSPTDGEGSVSFYADGSSAPISGCGPVKLSLVSSTYQAACSTSGLSATTHSISATYGGDTNYETSTGDLSGGQTVGPAPTAFSISVSPSSVPFGSAATLSETGLPSGAAGTVAFQSGATALCQFALPMTSCPSPKTLPAGTYTGISASFTAGTGGDYSSSTSTNTASLTVTGTATAAPVAVADHYWTPIGDTLVVNAANGVLANDTLNGASIVSHTNPAHGTLALAANGSFTYAPSRAFVGIDNFTYELQNSTGSSSATVTIDVPARADLSVTLSAPKTTSRGSPFNYVMTVTNTGPDPAIGVTSSLLVSPGLKITKATPNPSSQSAGLVAWSSGTLAAGATVTFTVAVTVNAAAPGEVEGVALSAATGSVDPDLANNAASTTTKV